jgi:hypothetical protein
MTIADPENSRPARRADVPATFRERQALENVFSAAQEELRRIAGTVRRGDMDATLGHTALVNEACLKLVGTLAVAETSLVHFKRIAARAMRQVLVEAAPDRGLSRRSSKSAPPAALRGRR